MHERAEARARTNNAVQIDCGFVAERFGNNAVSQRSQRHYDIHVAQPPQPCEDANFTQTSKAINFKHSLADAFDL